MTTYQVYKQYLKYYFPGDVSKYLTRNSYASLRNKLRETLLCLEENDTIVERQTFITDKCSEEGGIDGGQSSPTDETDSMKCNSTSVCNCSGRDIVCTCNGSQVVSTYDLPSINL